MNNIPCRYFKSAAGCRFGGNCRYSHSSTSTSSTIANNTTKEAPICIFYGSPGGCRYGQSCYYKHNESNKPKQEEPNLSNSSFDNVPKPDGQDELIVFGFIRELLANNNSNEKSNENLKDLILLCQKYYSIIIKWSEYNKANMCIIGGGNVIKKNKNNNWGSAFLSEEYDSGIHHWKFKIESLDSRRKYYVLFGIWKCNSGNHILDSFFTDKKNNGYGMNVIDGTLTIPNTPGCGGIKYATYCKKGDMIDMFCDFNKLELTYAINGKYYQNGQKIEMTKYKVAVTMYWEGDMIRFIEHDNKLFTK